MLKYLTKCNRLYCKQTNAEIKENYTMGKLIILRKLKVTFIAGLNFEFKLKIKC